MPRTAATGATPDRAETSGLIVGRARARASYAVRRPAGARSWLLLVPERGAGWASFAGREVALARGSAAVLPPHVAHGYGTDPAAGSWTFWWVHFRLRPDWRLLLAPAADEEGQVTHGLGDDVLADVVTGFVRLHAAARWPGHGPVPATGAGEALALAAADAGWRLAAPHVEALLVLLSQAPPAARADPRIARIINVVAADPAAPYTVARLANLVALSPSRLSHLFRAETGVSLMAHVRDVRLQHASRLLLGTGLSVGQVARASGFASQFHFSRAFSDRYGTAPTAHRERY
ncbi:helix-turn-helix domain-containing protein [Isoptericola hypogeus]|uniref:Helix-turn-helix domain-containing protein n=2 Tax=Isoptericola hypogeus TaxID=300179 RepID=A0ABN2JH32_9MICO